jgi:hypothetical protein
MRPSTNRSIVLALSVIATACSGDISSSLLSPTNASFTQTQGSNSVPFRGTIKLTEHGVLAPPHLLFTGAGDGNATQLGHYTVTFDAVADLATPTATGNFRFTAANGDQLITTFVGVGAVNIQPDIIEFTEEFTIVSGTGRFANATGAFTVRRIGIIDFATITSTSTGSIEGEIKLR